MKTLRKKDFLKKNTFSILKISQLKRELEKLKWVRKLREIKKRTVLQKIQILRTWNWNIAEKINLGVFLC